MKFFIGLRNALILTLGAVALAYGGVVLYRDLKPVVLAEQRSAARVTPTLPDNPTIEQLIAFTRQVIAIKVDGQLRAFELVSIDGRVHVVGSEHCAADPQCRAVVEAKNPDHFAILELHGGTDT